MRIKLEKGKQYELILLAKAGKTWKELSNQLDVKEIYLSGDLKRESTLISEELYAKLSNIANINFDKYVLDRLDNNWGRSKGGINSEGSTIRLIDIQFDEKLAEFVGAVLGDGHVCFLKKEGKNRKIGVYVVRVSGDLEKDREYHKYLLRLGLEVFKLKGKEILRKSNNERFLDFYSRELVEFFIGMGIESGDKIVNQSTIPGWIMGSNKYIAACLRGLIDTDGSIFRMSRKDPNLVRINFKNHNRTLLEDTRGAFIKLGFHPSKIILDNVFYISRQNEVRKYLKEVGFSNKKHKDRANAFLAP